MRILVLFTRDLRVHDHAALDEACRTASEVVPLFVLDPALLGASANRDRFLLESLVDLDRSLERLGGRLFVRRGAVVDEVMEVAVQAGCSRIFVTGDASAYARRRERLLAAACARARLELRVFPENAVVEPGGLPRATAYRVFTPYLRAWGDRPPRGLVPAPRRVSVPGDLEPGRRPDPSTVAPHAVDVPRGGERVGRRRLHAFLGRELQGYAEGRDDLAVEATSRLSPYLRFGCVSANEVAMRANGAAVAEPFVRQLAWRDFFLQLLAEDPALAWRSLRDPVGIAEAGVPAERALAAWRDGRTGLPLVDAGMRQLLREGWMHNRARLVVASFLTRRLGVPWQRGERHFSRLLIDADPANNAGNWQWAAGTGTDPRRTRTLNPVRQARRYDPSGAYVRRYVQELRDVQAPLIFTPWTDPSLMRRSGYPEPIVPVAT
ncbi:MAG TPA: deoxyribodipyrimidine photo-lyase [Actinomycetota bacterium]|nr:deoxyribodipyrimidine photo-lyase [Actinomycetota bacterium]